MKDCSPCPLYEVCHSQIVTSEAALGALLGIAKGSAALRERAVEVGGEKVLAEIRQVGGLEAALYLHENNEADVEAWLSRDDKVAQLYKETIKKIRTRNHLGTIRLERLQRTCNGPESRKKYRWFGKAITKCTSSVILPTDTNFEDLD